MSFSKRIRWWLRREKFKWQRARWGFSEYDIWDMDCYLAELLADMTAYMAKFEKTSSSMTPEEWQQYMINMSECFRQYNRDLPSPAYEEYKKHIVRENNNGHIVVKVENKYLEAWRKEEQEQREYKLRMLKQGLDMLFDKYEELWD